MTSKTLNPNVWVATADDKLKTQDVYQLAGKLAINAIENLADSVDPQIAEVIRGGKSMADKLKGAMSTVNDVKAALNSSNAADRLLAMAPQLKSSLKSATGIEINDALISKIQSSKNLLVGTEGALRRIKSTDFSNANAVGKLLNDYTKDNNLFKIADLGASVEMTAGIINVATKNGIPNSLEALTKNITDSGIIRQIASRTIPDTVLMCDLMGISTIATVLGEGAISKIIPNALSDVFKNWATGSHAAKASSSGEDVSAATTKINTFNELIATFDKADPNWRWHMRSYVNDQGLPASERVVDVSLATNQSADMQELLMAGVRASDDINIKMLALATQFKGMSVDTELAKHFPKTAVRAALVATTSNDPSALTYA